MPRIPSSRRFGEAYSDQMSLSAALKAAVVALAGPERVISEGDLEAAVLEDSNGRRTFRRLSAAELAELLAG